MTTTKEDAHRWMNTCLVALPFATLDAQSRGFSSGGGDSTRSGVGSHSDPTARFALQPSEAATWLVWLNEVFESLEIDISHYRKLIEQKIIANAKIDHFVGFAAMDSTFDLLFDLHNDALRMWPQPPKKGKVIGGVTIGMRGNTVENCGLCDLPVIGGRNDPIRRIDGKAFHGKSCWFTVMRSRNSRNCIINA